MFARTDSQARRIGFDLPTNAVEPSRPVAEGSGIDRFVELLIIGREDSLLHKKTGFRVDSYLRRRFEPDLLMGRVSVPFPQGSYGSFDTADS